jgi:hypothetical protein
MAASSAAAAPPLRYPGQRVEEASIAAAVPVFFVLIGLEDAWARRRGASVCVRADLGCGAGCRADLSKRGSVD